MSVIPEDVVDLLQPPAIAHVATIGPTGAPHVSPVIFAWDGELIRLSMNGDRQKRKNLARDPRVALSIVDPANPFRSVEVRGVVLRIEDDVDYAFNRSISRRYFGADGRDKLLPGESRVVVVIRPDRAFPFIGTPPEGATATS